MDNRQIISGIQMQKGNTFACFQYPDGNYEWKPCDLKEAKIRMDLGDGPRYFTWDDICKMARRIILLNNKN
jgi:hypothetical protein